MRHIECYNCGKALTDEEFETGAARWEAIPSWDGTDLQEAYVHTRDCWDDAEDAPEPWK